MPKKIDLTGQVFNRLTVVKEDSKRSGGHVCWLCQCSCGNPTLISVSGTHLRDGHTQSCGCIQKEKAKEIMKEKIQPLGVKAQENNLINQRFGLLTVIEFAYKENGKKYWKCICDCGNKKIVSGSDLVTNHTSSCGCLKCSTGELKIKKLLQENNIPFEQEKMFSNCNYKGRLRFDFYIDNKYLIEYDGNIHFKVTNGWNTQEHLIEAQQKDKIKTEWCKEHNISLIRIPYTRFKNLCIEDLLLDKTKFRVI